MEDCYLGYIKNSLNIDLLNSKNNDWKILKFSITQEPQTATPLYNAFKVKKNKLLKNKYPHFHIQP
jgi:hypothetical protein